MRAVVIVITCLLAMGSALGAYLLDQPLLWVAYAIFFGVELLAIYAWPRGY